MFLSVRSAVQTCKGWRVASLLVALWMSVLLAAPALAREHVQRLRPNDADARGYNVYLGFGEPPGPDSMDVGLLAPEADGVAEILLTDLPDDVEIQIEMTAYRDGLESPRSNRIVLPPLTPASEPASAVPSSSTTRTEPSSGSTGTSSVTTTTTAGDTPSSSPTRLTSSGSTGSTPSNGPSALSGKSVKKAQKQLRKAARKVQKLARKVQKLARKVQKLDTKLQGLEQEQGSLGAAASSGKLARMNRKISRAESKISGLMAELTAAQTSVVSLRQRLGS
jgi:hypothetical protein